MSGKLVFLVGVLGVGGYFGQKMMSFDSTVFNYPREQVVGMLVDAKTTLPRRDGPGEIRIWSTGRYKDGVTLNMRYASWAPLLECKAVITEIAPDKTRVVPDCGTSSSAGDSAIAQTQDELRSPMFEEHIQATLNKRAFDRTRVDGAQAAAVLKNMPGMQREALRRSDEAQQMAAEAGQ
jgi:hypothetical protein